MSKIMSKRPQVPRRDSDWSDINRWYHESKESKVKMQRTSPNRAPNANPLFEPVL